MIKRIKKMLNIVHEDFYKSIPVESERLKRNEYVEIFKNPTYSELRNLWMEDRSGRYDYFRFILNTTGLYLWDWNILHYEIESEVPELYQSRGGYYGVMKVVPTGGISIRLDIGREGLDNDKESDWEDIDKFTESFKSREEIENLRDGMGRIPSVSAEEVL